MAKDQYAFNPMWLSPELEFGSPQNIVESVPMSRYQPYIESVFGPEIPARPADRSAANAFFAAATAYSTDETLADIICDDNLNAALKVRKYIARWLQLTEPIFDATKTLDKSVTRQLKPYDEGVIPDRYDHELSYIVGLFFAGTQATSLALDMRHPSDVHPDLVRPMLARGATFAAGVPENPLPQSQFLGLPVIKVEYRKKVERLRADTVKLNAQAMSAAQKLPSILALADAQYELEGIINGID